MIGIFKRRKLDKDKLHRSLFDARHEALYSKALLDCIRAGQIAEVLEIVEYKLDLAVLRINSCVVDADEDERRNTFEMLRIIREYRLQHPRKTEAEISGDEGEDYSEGPETQEEVRKILAKVPND
jgi:hypothetical protein